ncbi:MAG: hypothetical protein Q9171_004447 [Xanthocarpia ochracea]
MPPCSTTSCTYASSSAPDVVPGSQHALNPEVVATICFGLVMFLLALLALWQGRKQLRRTGITSSQKSCWPRHFNTTARGAIGQAPPSGSAIISNTYVNVFVGNIESQSRTPPPTSLPPIASDPSDAYMRLPAPPAPVYAREISPTPPTTLMILPKLPFTEGHTSQPRQQR